MDALKRILSATTDGDMTDRFADMPYYILAQRWRYSGVFSLWEGYLEGHPHKSRDS